MALTYPGWLLDEAASVVGSPARFSAAPGRGLSGTRAAFAEGQAGDAFVKWAPGLGMDVIVEAERDAVRLLSRCPPEGVVRAAVDPDSTRALWFERLVPAVRAWEPADVEDALGVIGGLAGLPLPAHTFADVRIAGPDGLADAVEAARPALGADADGLAAGVDEYRRSVRTAVEVVCHADAHDDNWVLTAGGPVLVDFETLCAGPRGWDETLLVAHMDMDDRWRARLVEEVCGGLDRAVACAAAAAVRHVRHRANPDRAFARLGEEMLPRHLRLWRQLAL